MVPDVSAVLSYPTSIFIGHDGRIRWIRSGFAGTPSGDHHERLDAEMELKISSLLYESADERFSRTISFREGE